MRTLRDWMAMEAGAAVLPVRLLAGAGAWSIDAMLVADHRPRKQTGYRV